MGKQAKITTPSGKVVTGEVIRRDQPKITAEEHLGAALTLGLSAASWPETKTTVQDEDGNYWTGKRTR